MNKSALVCLAPGSEEIEVVTTLNLLIRGGIIVTLASIVNDDQKIVSCAYGTRLVVDAPLTQVADKKYDIIILPGGLKGVEYFRDSLLLVNTIRRFHSLGRIVAAICAAPGAVLVSHNLFPTGKMTGFPGLKEIIPAVQWRDERVVWDPYVNLLTSQGPGTAIDFALKIIDLLVGKEKAHEVASSLVIAEGIYDYH